MTSDFALLGMVITLLLAVIALGFWAGRTTEKIRNNRFDIEEQKEDFKTYQNYNREEHKSMIVKLDTIITNGSKHAER